MWAVLVPISILYVIRYAKRVATQPEKSVVGISATNAEEARAFAHVSRATIVTAFQSASGFVNLITPTSAVIMGGLALSKVGYDRYVRFVWPYLVIVFIVCCAFLGISAAV